MKKIILMNFVLLISSLSFAVSKPRQPRSQAIRSAQIATDSVRAHNYRVFNFEGYPDNSEARITVKTDKVTPQYLPNSWLTAVKIYADFPNGDSYSYVMMYRSDMRSWVFESGRATKKTSKATFEYDTRINSKAQYEISVTKTMPGKKPTTTTYNLQPMSEGGIITLVGPLKTFDDELQLVKVLEVKSDGSYMHYFYQLKPGTGRSKNSLEIFSEGQLKEYEVQGFRSLLPEQPRRN